MYNASILKEEAKLESMSGIFSDALGFFQPAITIIEIKYI
jgi:hypothetical protein